jgi:hypothetical protein
MLTGDEEDRALRTVIELNQGRVLRVVKGAVVQVSKDEGRMCCGASKCYCVQASGGGKQCETYYPNTTGYSYAILCPIPCGC